MRAAMVVLTAFLSASPVSAQNIVRGCVLDAVVRVPVAGAQVRVGGNNSVVADSDGRFQLAPLPSGRVELRVERIGYRPLLRTMDVVANTELTLYLEPLAEAHDALVVTASRRLQRLGDAPVTTELITRREIEETGATDIAGVLFEHTGIEMEGGIPAGAGALLQGFGTERVLILLDGQPLPGRIAGTFDLARLPATLLERVEVVKGPQSTLFGSAAMGGVINLITRQPERALHAAGQLLGGSEGRLDGSARMQGAVLGAAFLAQGGRRQVDQAAGRADPSGARSERWDGLLKARVPSAAGAIELSALIVDERARWASGQLFNFADNRQIALRASTDWQVAGHHFSPALYWSDFDHYARRSNSERPPATGDRETQRTAEAELLYSTNLGAHSTDAGIELRQDRIESPRVAGAVRALDVVEGFTQLTLVQGNFRVVPGLRWSNSEAWGSHWTPRLALLYRPVPGLALRASAGSAFRAPEFKELYMRFANVTPGFSYIVQGNANLGPETARNVSLGIELTHARSYLRVQGFYNRFDDFIETRALGDSSGYLIFSYGNIEDGSTRGGELEAGTEARSARVEVGYSFLDARAEATDLPLLGRPRHSGRVLLAYTTRFGLRFNLTGVHTGSTPLQRDSVETITREDFTRFDLRMAQRVAQPVEISFGIDNIFDRTPGNWPGFTGRQLYGGLSWRLGPDVP
jgi:outer membrane receptor for ferrienterochelin and colicins